MIKQTLFAVTALSFLLFYTACSDTTTAESDGKVVGTVSQSALTENGLGTLSDEPDDYKKIVTSYTWNRIETDLKKLYPSSDYPAGDANYPVEITFSPQRLVAYANCFKITADYEIDGKELIFYRPQQQPDPDHASCYDYEGADDAVYALVSHDFRIIGTTGRSIKLKASDLPVTFTLSRD